MRGPTGMVDVTAGKQRQLNEVDTLFYAHSRQAEGLYRFAGCFECAAPTLSEEQLRDGLEQVIERYPAAVLFDQDGPRAAPVRSLEFTSEPALQEFYADSLARPYQFGNVLVHATLITKPDGARALFLLIPHFAGDSKIAVFVLGQVLRAPATHDEVEKLEFVSYRDLARANTHSFWQRLRGLWRELVEMNQCFAFRSPAKGRVAVATVFLEPTEVRRINGARRAWGLSRALLLQVAALHAYRLVAPPRLARVFNVIYDNTPALPTVNNCFRSMPLVMARGSQGSTMESCRDRFKRLLTLYDKPYNRYAFFFRSLLVRLLPIFLIKRVFVASTRAVQHYISYVFLDGKLEVPAELAKDLRIWGNIEPVGHSLSNFNVIEYNKQVSLNITWDTRVLGDSFGHDFLARLRAVFEEDCAERPR